MADIRLRIEVNPNAETETLGTITNKIDSVGTNSNLSNVSFKASSSGVYTNTDNPKESGREMFSWANNGVLKFNSDGLLSTDGVVAGELASETDPDMFVWGAVPSSKQYSVKLTFSNATSLKDIVVYGDKTANQFPTKAIIDGTKTIYSDDYQWAINMDTEKETHTIEFVEWNRANYSACLTKIMVMLRYFDIYKGWIDSVESLTQSTSDPSSIQYGVLANSGSISLLDFNEELSEYVRDGIIDVQNVPISIYLNKNQIQSHITTDSNYHKDNRTLAFQLSNKLYQLKQVQINRFFDRGTTGEKITFYYLIQSALNNSNFDKIFNMSIAEFLTILTSNTIIVNNNEITIENYLKNIIIEDGTAFIRPDSIYNFLDKICVTTQLNLIQLDNGDIKFISSRPIFNNVNRAIYIPRYVKRTELETDLFIKNKINKINFKQNNTISDFKDVANRTISLRVNNEVSLSNLDKGQIIIDNNRYYLCFFFTANANNTILTNNNYNIDNILSSTIIVRDANGIGNGGSVANFYFAQGNKENFNFREFLGGTELLYELTTENSITLAFSQDITDLHRDNLLEVEISIMPRSVQSVQKYINYGTLLESNNYYNFEFDNEYLSTSVKYNNNSTSFYDIIANNILTDYSQGISTGNIELFCTNLKYQDGTMAKDYSKGEILNIGDIIYFDNDLDNNLNQRYWRVVGRTFNFNGDIKLVLELQQAKLISTT